MHQFKKMILSIQSDSATNAPANGNMYLTNNNSPASGVNIQTVSVNGSEVVVSGRSFPILPGENNILAEYIVGGGTNSIITMASNNAADAPVNLYVATETPLQTCQLTSGYIEITGINLSTAPAVSITLDVEGGSCL
jgi:hypothetical protein